MNDNEVVEQEGEEPFAKPKETVRKSPRVRKRGSSTAESPARPTPAPQGVLRVRTLTIRNRSGLLLFLPVLNDDGTKTLLRMGANATVQILEDHLTDHARRLLAQGQISLEPHR